MNYRPVSHILESSIIDMGSFQVKQPLPTQKVPQISPFLLLHHFGPIKVEPGFDPIDLGPHPHRGFEPVTFLYQGGIRHKDSLGNEGILEAGDIQWMTAGRGIVHTEDSIENSPNLHAAQLWIALPETLADCEPDFAHYSELPLWHSAGVQFTLLAGSYGEFQSPTAVHSPILGMDLLSVSGGVVRLQLNPEFEYGFLTLTGQVNVQGDSYSTDEFAYLEKGGSTLELELGVDSRVLLLGGVPVDQPVQMWWNFVGYSKEAIAAAQRDWEHGDSRFGDVKDPTSLTGKALRLTAPVLPWK